jgi:uracil-DNA glycosylase
MTASDFIPVEADLSHLRTASKGCRGCDLYARATQTVFGEGGPSRLMIVGEQPGDEEDRSGRPFVGPAGRLLDVSLEQAGIDRGSVYLTNAVKHFKWEERGTRRLHKKPSVGEVHACLPWLEAEIRVVQPDIVACMGATAAQALLGPDIRVTLVRGEFVPSPLPALVFVTVHPASILRATGAEERNMEEKRFVVDLKRVSRKLESLERAKERSLPD